jgi:hypothetical protein
MYYIKLDMAAAAGAGAADILVELKNVEVSGYKNLANNDEGFTNDNFKTTFGNVIDNQRLKGLYDSKYFTDLFKAIEIMDNDDLGNVLETPDLTGRSTNKQLVSNLIHTGNEEIDKAADISMIHAKSDGDDAVDGKQLLVHSTKDRIGHWTACLLATICNKHIGNTFLAK